MTEYDMECPVCGEEISVDVPTEVDQIGEARLRMAFEEHAREHRGYRLLFAAIRLWVRGQIRRIRS